MDPATASMLQKLALVLFWTVAVYRIGVWHGRRSAGRDALSGIRPSPGPASMQKISRLAPETRAAIEEALAAGNKIAAIRILREATGMGLKESKKAIEAGLPPA